MPTLAQTPDHEICPGERPPLVSVVIPNYNYGRYLKNAIESVLEQTYPHVEVIVVDDGSTDDSERVVQDYSERVRWLKQANQGVSAARNRGIRESQGALVAFLDADDAWRADKLAQQVPRFTRPGVGMVYSGVRFVDEPGRPLRTRVVGESGRVLRGMALMRGPGVPASGSSAVLRRECLDRIGGFDVTLSTAADWDMWRRVACHYEIEMVREPLIDYRLHGSAMHKNVDVFERDMLRAFERMFADPAAQDVYPLCRRCYANLYVTLAGSYFLTRRWSAGFRWAARSLVTRPLSASYLAAFPIRWLGRRLGLAEDARLL